MHAPAYICGIVEAHMLEYLEKVHGVDLDAKLDDKYHLVSYKKAADYAMWETIHDDDPAKENVKDVLKSIKNPNAYPTELNIAIAAQVTANACTKGA